MLQSDDTKPIALDKKTSGKTIDKKKHGRGSSMLCSTFRAFSSSEFSSGVVFIIFQYIKQLSLCQGHVFEFE